MQTDLFGEDRSFAPDAPPRDPAPPPRAVEGGMERLFAAYRDLADLYQAMVEEADARAERYLDLVNETGDFGEAAAAQREALRHISGLADAERRAEEAGSMLAEIEARIMAAPTVTFGDLRLKALVVQRCLEDQSPHIELDYDGALRALVRDIAGEANA